MRFVTAALLSSIVALSTIIGPAPAEAAVTPVSPGYDVQVLHVTGGRVTLPFRGTAGRIATVQVVDDSLAHPASIALVRPNGTTLGSKTFGGYWFGTYPTLDVTGTWKLALRPAAGDVGDVSVQISYAAAAAPTLPAGADRTVRIKQAGTVQAYSLAGTIGNRPVLSIVSSVWNSGGATLYPAASFSLFRPDGSSWGDFESICGGCTPPYREARPNDSQVSTFDKNGTWTLVVRGGTDEVGSSKFRLSLVNDQNLRITPGAITTATVKTPGQKVNYVFDGTAGQRPVIDLLSQNWLSPEGYTQSADIAVFRPDGTYFDTWSQGGSGNDITWFESAPLDVTGRWRLFLAPLEGATGSQQMLFNTVTTPAPRAVTVGSSVRVTSPTAGVNTDLTIPAQPGRRVALTVTQADWHSRTAGNAAGSGTASVDLLDAAGSTLGYASLPVSGAGSADIAAPATGSGTWTLRVDPGTDSTGSTTFSLTTVTDVTGTLTPGVPATVAFTQPYQQAQLNFTLPDPNSRAHVQITGSTLTGATVKTVSSDGQIVDSWALTEPGDADFVLSPVFWETQQTLVIDPAADATGTLSVTVTPWG